MHRFEKRSQEGPRLRAAWLRGLLALALVGVGLAGVPPTAAHAAGGISLDKTSSGSALFGGQVDYHLAVSNPAGSGVEQYNLSYVDVLPTGVSYVAGSAAPSSYGEPQVITITDDATTTPPTTHQVLVWSNVADLTPGATRTLSFKAALSPTVYPVGATVTNNAAAYSSSTPQEVPAFDDQGKPVAGTNVVSSTDSASAQVTAIKLAKGEASPENELVRGVNDNQTVYSLVVTNNSVGSSSGVVVSDYLPAGLEFLGCGGPFNSSIPEYPGASNTVATVADCLEPASVATVLDPAGYPAGVYTKVTWNLGGLSAGASQTIHYAAGIPQRANTMSWTGTAPTAASGDQAANLANNNGASSRETGVEKLFTNYATVTGQFGGSAVSDSANSSVTSEDLRMVKTVSPQTFTQGGLATYTLDIAASEYVDLADLLITDTLPDGMCVIDAAKNWTPLPACAARPGHGPTNAAITQAVMNADGTSSLTIKPDTTSLAHNGHLVITYQALMLPNYSRSGQPTSAGDSFTNQAAITATSTPRSDVGTPDSGSVTVSDDSSATMAAGAPTLTKLRMPKASPMTCSSDPDAYTVDSRGAASEPGFTEGDRVCFLLVVQFPSGVDTRNAQLTDFLPANLSFESARELNPSGLIAATTPATPTSYVTWSLGSGSPQVVPKGTRFEVVVSAIVTSPPTLTSASSPQALDRDNLAKFRYTNSAGMSDSLRDWVSLPVAPAPAIGVVKGIQKINATGIDTGTTPGNVDGRTVRAGDEVTFRIDLQNLSRAGDDNAAPIASPDLWDVLPVGITCEAIQAISNGGTCYNAGAAGRPALASGDSSSSVIRWQLGTGFVLDPQARGQVSYTMLVPATVSVSTVFTNTAAVTSYTTPTNVSDNGVPRVATHNPAANVSAAVAPAAMDVPAASDISSVVVPDAKVAKGNLTDLTEAGNTISQAVVGETLTYTVGITVPAKTSVYNAVLADPMPTGLAFVGPATVLYSASGISPATSPLPSGAGINITLDPATGILRFGTGYTNASDTDQLFEVRIPARISTLASNTQITRTNTATFTSDTAATGGVAIPPRTASSSVAVVEPSPSLAKAASPTSVTGGSVVTYTLTAANASGRPPLHDTWVVDCLPGTLSFGSFTQTPAGTSATTTSGTGSNGCASGYTRIAWQITNLAGGASLALKYTATVNASPAGGASYLNVATLTGSTLSDGKTDPTGADNPNERTYVRTAQRALTVSGASIDKTATPTLLAPGQLGSYTVKVGIPANVAFYDSAVMDALPAQMTYVGTTSVSCTNADHSDCSAAIPGTVLGPTSSLVGWLVGDLAPSTQARTITIVYTARMAAAGNTAGATRTNTAHFRWNLADGSNPTAPSTSWGAAGVNKAAAVTVIEPLVSVAKTVNGGGTVHAEPGDPLRYQVVATNSNTANSADAFNLTVVDAVPAGVVIDPASLHDSGGVLSGTNADGSGGLITWTIVGPLAKGASVTFTYTGVLAASGTIRTTDVEKNTATVQHYESQPSGGRTDYPPTSASASVIPQFPHISSAKSVASGPAYLGKPKAWTLTLTNDGTAAAHRVTAIDTLPMNWTYDTGSATVIVAGGTATSIEPVVSIDGAGHQVLAWSDLGTVPASGANSVVITYAATPKDPDAAVDPGVGSVTSHTNIVTATAQDATGATGNASGDYHGAPATASTRIDAADVRLTKTSGGAVAGQPIHYTLAVANNGPDTAVGPFQVVDTLPAGLGAISWSGQGWDCSQATTTLTCVRANAGDTLASGAGFPDITVIAQLPASTSAGTSLANSATVTGATHDPNPDNNTGSVTDPVTRSVDLGIVKRTSGTAVAGTQLSYTLDVTNHGPSDASGPIVVTDQLPDATDFVSASGAGWSCQNVGRQLTCTHSAGLSNAAVAGQLTVVVLVSAEASGELTNTASVRGPETDPEPSNDTSTVTDAVHTSADLAINKDHLGAFTPGDRGVYEITVTNHGPSRAASPVRVTDQLASELSFVSDNSDDWTCATDADNLLTCEYAEALPPGKSTAFRITVAIDAASTADVRNSATVSSPTDDPQPGNNTDGDTTGVDVLADLGIRKSHSGKATAGEDFDFVLDVTNHGKSDSPGPITVTDSLPDQLTFVSAAGSGWDCSADGRLVTCERADGLAAGAHAPAITVRTRVAADAGPAGLTNIASVSGTAPDPDPDNNTSTDEFDVVDRANVSITKSVDPSSVSAGREVAWTLTVHNDGPSVADSVQIGDQLPAGLSLAGIDAEAPVHCHDGAPVDCRVIAMPPRTSYQITVRTLVGAGVADGATITNRATVSTATPGDDPSDNTAEATVDVTTDADLSLVKTHVGDSVVAGEKLTFQLAVHNAGPSDAAADVVVTDTLPVGMNYLSSTGTQWACSAAEPDSSGQKVTCTLADSAPVLAGTDAPPLALTVQVDSEVDPDALTGGVLTNAASVTTPTHDPRPANNADEDQVPVHTRADLSIVKSHSGQARIGDPLTFTLQVANSGPSAARAVKVSDVLPAGLDYLAAVGDGWSCKAEDREVTCSLADPLASGAVASPIQVTASVVAAAYPSVANTATVDAATHDPNPDDNGSTDRVDIPAQVDLGVTKTHQPQELQVGAEATYSLTVTNSGKTDDPGPVRLSDPLPSGLTLVSASGDGWDCSATGQDLTCVRKDGLAKDATSMVSLVVMVGPEAYPGLTNIASVSSPAEDLDPDNNVAKDPAVVLPQYQLTVTKRLSRISKTQAVWSILVANEGPNEAPGGAVVTDDLPRGLSLTNWSGVDWACASAGQVVTCSFPRAIAAGESVGFQLETSIAAGVRGEVINSATVSGGNTSTASGKVPAIDDWLAYTGAAPEGIVLLGLSSLLAGVLLVSRRRRRS